MKASLKKVRSAYGIDEYRLENGLRVLYKHDSAAPVAAVCVTFHVGSRNEAPGHRGSTHILEHLLFKDTERFNRKNGNSITDYLEWFGALMNATTWVDRTNYFELLPRERVEEAIAVEADRMRNSLFNDEDLASEMPVVRNEYERSRNNPFELLDEEVMAKAFTTHPYRIPTIGTKEDIENSTSKKLHEFYDTFYWPNNATLAVFGDVPWKKVEKLVLKYFGPIPPSPRRIPKLKVTEPAQKRPRSVSLKKPLGIGIGVLGYKVPEGTHPDFPAVALLGTILVEGFSSRFQKALVDTGLAADVSLFLFPLHDPGLMNFIAHAAEKVPPKKLLELMRKELRKFSAEGPSQEEVERARERLLASFAQEKDGVFAEIRAVSESVAAGDWMLSYRMEKKVRSLQPKDILRVARKYLVSKGETSGMLLNTQ